MALSNLLLSIVLLTLPLTNALSILRRTPPPTQTRWLENVRLEAASEYFDVSSHVNLTFTVHGQDEIIKLQLAPNDDVVSCLESIRYLAPDGSISHTQNFKRSNHFIYKGDASVYNSIQNSWDIVGTSRITIRLAGKYPLFEGIFTLNNDRFNVHIDATVSRALVPEGGPAGNSGRTFMVVWKEGDVKREKSSPKDLKKRGTDENDEPVCDVDIFEQSIAQHIVLQKYYSVYDHGDQHDLGRDDKESVAEHSSKYIAYIGIATDCSYTTEFESLDDMRSHIFTQINVASQVYEDDFNISLAIRDLSISDTACPSIAVPSLPWNLPCSNFDAATRLNSFSRWTSRFENRNALWTLMSGCSTGAASSTGRSSWLDKACRHGTGDISMGKQLPDVFIYQHHH